MIGVLSSLAGSALGDVPSIAWTQTARNDDNTLVLLQEMDALQMQPMDAAPDGPSIIVNSKQKHQEFAGFGGAFTEASAINWRTLTDSSGPSSSAEGDSGVGGERTDSCVSAGSSACSAAAIAPCRPRRPSSSSERCARAATLAARSGAIDATHCQREESVRYRTACSSTPLGEARGGSGGRADGDCPID